MVVCEVVDGEPPTGDQLVVEGVVLLSSRVMIAMLSIQRFCTPTLASRPPGRTSSVLVGVVRRRVVSCLSVVWWPSRCGMGSGDGVGRLWLVGVAERRL